MTTWLMYGLPIVVLFVLFVGIRLFQRVIVYEYQRGLKYAGGRFEAVLSPGQYWVYRPSTSVDVVDMRRTLLPVPGQEVLTQDGAAVKVTLTAEFAIVDPFKARHQTADFAAACYVQLQSALREAVCSLTTEQLLQQRSAVGEQVAALCRRPFEALGLELHAVAVKDLLLPKELKKAYLDLVKAQKEGQAALERARLETAALRSLANAARMVEDQPALLQLRWLQAIGQSTGNTVVVGGDLPATGRKPKKTGDQNQPPEGNE